MAILDMFDGQGGPIEPPLQALPRSLGERVEATAGEIFAPNRYFLIAGERQDRWQKAIDALHEATGEQFPNPYASVTAKEALDPQFSPDRVIAARKQRIIDAHRAVTRDVGADLPNPELIDQQIQDESRSARQLAARYEGTGNGVLNWVAAMGMSSVEPVNVLALAVPVTRLPTAAEVLAGQTVLRNVSREALFQGAANAAFAGVTEALDAPYGEGKGWEEIATSVGAAGVFGAALGGGLRAVHLRLMERPDALLKAPLEVRDAARVVEAQALYSGQNRLGIDPMLHERYQGRAMDAVLRGQPVDLGALGRTLDTPMTALGTILREQGGRPTITGLGNVLDRIHALPDTELEAVLRQSRPQAFAKLDDVQRRAAELDQRVAAIHEEMGQIGFADVVDPDTGARLADIEDRLAKRGLRKAERADLEREREMIMQSVDPRGQVQQELKATRAEFFPEQVKALREIAEQRAALQREAEVARGEVEREIEQARKKLGDMSAARAFSDEVPAETLAREFGAADVPGLAEAIQRAEMMRHAAVAREVLAGAPETPRAPERAAAPVERAPGAAPMPPEQAAALKAEAARLVEANPERTVAIGDTEMTAAKALEEADMMEKDAAAALGCAIGAL